MGENIDKIMTVFVDRDGNCRIVIPKKIVKHFDLGGRVQYVNCMIVKEGILLVPLSLPKLRRV